MDYLLTMDYFSGFFEVDKMTTTTASQVINKLTTTTASQVVNKLTTTTASQVINKMTTTTASQVINKMTTTTASQVINKMTTTTASQVINKLKPHFARYSIPRQLVSDNGPQFSSREFEKFGCGVGKEYTAQYD